MKDDRKIKTLESIWEEAGIPINEEVVKGYIMGVLEPLHTGVRNIACFTINIFGIEEGMRLALKICKAYGFRIAYVAEGFNGIKDELWVVKKDNPIQFNNIPSRMSNNPNDHRIRGHLLGYNEEIIESYFLED